MNENCSRQDVVDIFLSCRYNNIRSGFQKNPYWPQSENNRSENENY